MGELKESSIVTILSVIGLIFGFIGMLCSFVPFLGIFALFISFPATVVSVFGLLIAYMLRAKKTFILVSFTICLIGLTISGSQYAILAAYNESRRAPERTVLKVAEINIPQEKPQQLSQSEQIIENLKNAKNNQALSNSDDQPQYRVVIPKSENPLLELQKQLKEIDDLVENSQKKSIEDFNKTVLDCQRANEQIMQDTLRQMKQLENTYGR